MYEDVIYNLDDSNFSSSWVREKNNMKSQLRLTAEELSSIYTRVDNDLTTMQTEISQTAEQILLKASKTEVDEWGNTLEEKIAEITVDSEQIKTVISNELKSGGSIYKSMNSSIQQKANAILFTVSQYSHDYFESEEEPTRLNTTDEQKLMMCLYNGEWFVYDNALRGWISTSEQGAEIRTQFKQTADGFELSGNVQIDGNLITTGTISADRIETSALACNKLYDGNYEIENSPYFAVTTPASTTDYADLGLYKANISAAPASLSCHFGASYVLSKDIDTGYHHHATKFYANKNNFLSVANDFLNGNSSKPNEYYSDINSHSGRAYAEGIWDFTNAFVILPKSSKTTGDGRKIYYDTSKEEAVKGVE